MWFTPRQRSQKILKTSKSLPHQQRNKRPANHRGHSVSEKKGNRKNEKENRDRNDHFFRAENPRNLTWNNLRQREPQVRLKINWISLVFREIQLLLRGLPFFMGAGGMRIFQKISKIFVPPKNLSKIFRTATQKKILIPSFPQKKWKTPNIIFFSTNQTKA